jgi:hypothetical protein
VVGASDGHGTELGSRPELKTAGSSPAVLNRFYGNSGS